MITEVRIQVFPSFDDLTHDNPKCGGAMERGRCPECGSVIGGSNHSLDTSNARSEEFDRLARTMNADIGESPWANPH